MKALQSHVLRSTLMANTLKGRMALLRLLLATHLRKWLCEWIPRVTIPITVAREPIALRRVRLEGEARRLAMTEAIGIIPALAILIRKALLLIDLRRPLTPSGVDELRRLDHIGRAAVRIKVVIEDAA